MQSINDAEMGDQVSFFHRSLFTPTSTNSFSSPLLPPRAPQPLLHSAASTNLTSRPIFNLSSFSPHPFRPSPLLPSLIQVRHVSSRERKKRRKPMSPVTSKLKKTKIKSYSSFKLRFRVMNDGNIRRWKEGKRHNAHLKSKKSKRRLRKPGIVPAAYAKVMKKLSFCG